MKPSAPLRTRPAMLAIALATLVHAGCPVAATSQTVITDGLSPSFKAVASHLELGGCAFQYSEAGGFGTWAAFMDEFIKAMPASERKDMPPDFSLMKTFDMLGLNSVAATGSSSRRRADGSYHSRMFAYMPQGRKGLMTLGGGPAAKWLLHETAPKDTDLALEFSINLKDIARDTLPHFLEFMPAKERAVFEEQMSRPDPATGLSPKQIMEKLDARIGIFLRLDPTQKFQPAPDAPVFPGLDGVIVMDHLGWLMEALKPQMMQALARPGSPATASTEGGFFSIRFNTPAGPPPMDYQPVLRFDTKADRILIASRPALLDLVTTGGEKITAGADFARTWRDLPAEGNGCIYASTRFMQTLSNVMENAMLSSTTKTPASASDKLIIQKMLNVFKPYLSQGQAIAFANQPDGMMTTANTSIALGSPSLSNFYAVGVLAGLAVPAFTKIQEKGNDTKTINQLKQLVVGLKISAADHDGKYPAQLADLIKEGILDDTKLFEFSDPNTHERLAPLYNNQLTDTSNAGEILLAAPTPNKSGKRIAAFNDGSVRLITEAEFQELWMKK